MKALDALGNPVRREMLALLRDRPRPVGELAERFPISRPAVSRHLKVLEGAGLVEHESVGRENHYRVCREGFEAVEAWLDAFWDEALQRFKLVAENLDDPESP